MSKWTYEKRIRIPLDGSDCLLFTKSGLQIASGYKRIVIGQRGPYIECSENQIFKNNISVPESQKYRLTSDLVYYNEWRSNDDTNVKIYEQKRTVAYADYRLGMWYISPFELKTEDIDEIVRPLPEKEE